jgi:hypothetical protein
MDQGRYLSCGLQRLGRNHLVTGGGLLQIFRLCLGDGLWRQFQLVMCFAQFEKGEGELWR